MESFAVLSHDDVMLSSGTALVCNADTHLREEGPALQIWRLSIIFEQQ
jgi:hypothetical protein